MAAEKTFENKIKKQLESKGYWFVKFFANAYTKVGVPDILSCVNGYFLGIEVKAPNGKPSELQKYNIRCIEQCHGIGIVLYPDQYDDFLKLLECLSEHEVMDAWSIANKINKRWR